MSIKADINWIRTELEHINDPALVETLKKILESRRSEQDQETKQMFIEGLEDLRNGNVISSEDLKKEVETWGRKT